MPNPAKSKPSVATSVFRFMRIALFAFAPALAVPGLSSNRAALLAAGAAALETAFRVVCPDGAAVLGKVMTSVMKFAPAPAATVKATNPAAAPTVDAVAAVVEQVATVVQAAETETPVEAATKVRVL